MLETGELGEREREGYGGGKDEHALASHFPSGENFTAETPAVWPWRVYFSSYSGRIGGGVGGFESAIVEGRRVGECRMFEGD